MGKKTFFVKLELFKCQDLIALTNEVQDVSSAYATFTLGGLTKTSTCIKSSLDPRWSPSEKFEFEVDEWENEFLIAQVFDRSKDGQDNLIGSAVIPLALYAGSRNSEMCSYPLVLPDEVGEMGLPKSDMFLQIRLLNGDGSLVEELCW
ncbi:hypothetical protein CCR75_008565 [Bremia lactucae]|uniref:C2 domain-containing protein n=1 Tax=Bremia lactucae TaxID=4779 RepID=A0A976ICC1_BRELC|nr:hypothetical protein CCR75_008565 [Bremia lactucae]